MVLFENETEVDEKKSKFVDLPEETTVLELALAVHANEFRSGWSHV
jgi:hypothetical protein